MAADRLRTRCCQTRFPTCSLILLTSFKKSCSLRRPSSRSRLATKLRGGVWMLVAAALLLLAGAVFSQALVIWITTFDIALHMACLIVGAMLLVLASIALPRRSRRRKSRTSRPPEASITSKKTSAQPRSN